MKWADSEISSMMDEGGSSALDHLISVYNATGIKPKELEELQNTDCAYDVFHIWTSFMDLSATRTSNGFGPNPISYQEILSYMLTRDVSLDSEEVEMLKHIDILYLNKMNSKISNNNK